MKELFGKVGGKLSLKSTLTLGIQLICRFEKLHEKGIIYRDVKPQNFVMGVSKKRKLIYLVDFGLSTRFLKSQNTLNQNTPTLNQNTPTLNQNTPTLNQNTPTLNQNTPTLNQNEKRSEENLEISKNKINLFSTTKSQIKQEINIQSKEDNQEIKGDIKEEDHISKEIQNFVGTDIYGFTKFFFIFFSFLLIFIFIFILLIFIFI